MNSPQVESLKNILRFYNPHFYKEDGVVPQNNVLHFISLTIDFIFFQKMCTNGALQRRVPVPAILLRLFNIVRDACVQFAIILQISLLQ